MVTKKSKRKDFLDIKLVNRKDQKERLPLSLAHSAFKKLHIGEDISDQELEALFDSWYVMPAKKIKRNNTVKREILYIAPDNHASIFFPDIESELIEYFTKHPEKLHSIPPRKFEEFIAAIFKSNGFVVELTPETRDGGFDIIAIENNSLIGESKYLIECKRYSPENKVGIGVVQRMLGVLEYQKANKGIIATTSSFTKDAINFAQYSKHRLLLNDYEVIKSWMTTFR